MSLDKTKEKSGNPKKFANSIAKDLKKSDILVRIVDTDRGCYIYVR
jgi:hypothetical protein